MDPRTPVLVGIGVATQREDDPTHALEPIDLMLAAVRSAGADAAADAQALLAGIGRIGVPKGRWRYRNPGGEIAREIGADRAVSLLASVGVLQQTLLGDACRAIAAGETDTALVVGGDAGYRMLRASIKDLPHVERQQEDEPDVSLAPADELRHPAELRAGMKMPVGLYAIMESAYRAQHGWSVDAHRDRLAQMYSRFSEIAADNPAAWNRKRVAAETVRTTTMCCRPRAEWRRCYGTGAAATGSCRRCPVSSPSRASACGRASPDAMASRCAMCRTMSRAPCRRSRSSSPPAAPARLRATR